jgi:hypothetical protein
VTQVLADHHDPAVTTDHLALLADRLDARIDLHVSVLLVELLGLLVPVDDSSTGEVVGRELYNDAVFRQDADVVLPHLAADVGENLVTVLQLNAKHRIGQGFDNATLNLDGSVFLSHFLRDSPGHTLSRVTEPGSFVLPVRWH